MNKSKIILILLLCGLGYGLYTINTSYTPQPQTESPDLLPPSDEASKLPNLRRRPRRPKQSTYDDAVDLARKNNKHMLIWLNYENPTLEKQLVEFVHYHTTQFDTARFASGVIVGKKAGDEFYRFDISANDVSLNSIKDKVK